MGRARWSLVGVQILGWMTILGIFGLIILLIRALILILTGNLDLTGLVLTFGLTLLLTVLIPILFLIDSVFVNLMARAFGGRGTLVAQIYSCLLIQIPLTLVGSMLTYVPRVGIALGILFGFVAFIYGLLLQVFAVVAVHRLDARMAVAAVLIPAVITLLIAWLLIAAFLPIFAFAIVRSLSNIDAFLMVS